MSLGRRLIVVRHAKTEPFAARDHERALTTPGLRAARSIGRQLKERSCLPDYALVSSATRTRQTWTAIQAEIGADAHAEFSDDLYRAGPEDVIEAARWVPADAHTVIYVGHNPTAGELPLLLDDGNGDRTAIAAVLAGYPTSAVTVFEVATPWADLRMGGARLVDYFVGDRN